MWMKKNSQVQDYLYLLLVSQYTVVRLSLRRLSSGLFASTYKLSTGEVRKAPRHNRRP